jgi:hypothetical protein
MARIRLRIRIRCRYARRARQSLKFSIEVKLVFCPNCGTQNPETAQTCSKCNFNLKGAAAPKFKGTMLMMNQPGTTPPAPPAPPAPPGGAAPPPRPAGVPSAGPSKLKGTMVGVAPPVALPGSGAAPPPAPPAPPAPSAPPLAPMPMPEQPAAFNPTGQQVNPLGGTMVADAAGGGYGAPAAPPDFGQPAAQSPYGAPPPPMGASPYAPPPGQDPYAPQQGYGAQPGFPGAPGAPPPQDFGAQMGAGYNQAAQGMGQAVGQMDQAFGGMAQQAGYGAPMQQGMPGAPMQPGAPGSDINTTMPLIIGIVSTLCCGLSLFCGIIAIIFSFQAKTLLQQGQVDQARAKVGTAKLVGFIGLGLGVLSWIAGIIVQVVLR